jgi:glyoxylase-like metal-dependent hydrolase (beta-lactamase superfamily II)
MNANVKTFYDPDTFTLTYVVSDDATKDCVVIDPVLDYNPIGSKIEDTSYEQVKKYIQDNGLNLKMVLETHAHADHLSSSQLFKRDFPGVPVAIGEHIQAVQEVFKGVYNLEDEFKTDGSQFEKLIKDGEEFSVGSITVKALHTPGHTPACMSYVIDDAVFTGDALFMPDYGTGRCDFPKGDAEELYNSVHEKLYHLPDETRVFVGHDYQPGGRDVAFESTIGEEKANNIQLKADTTKEQFVSFRTERDSGLAAPKLIYQSIQVNIEAGHLPHEEENGKSYLKMPLNLQF